MKTVIVYYSHSNNTRAAAEILKNKLNADIVELTEIRTTRQTGGLSYPCKGLLPASA